MKNLFFRTSVAPYRIDTYNALHDKLNFELYFYRNQANDIALDYKKLYEDCSFTPHVLKGIELGSSSRKLCRGLLKLLRKNKPDVVIVPEFQILTIQILFLRMFLRKKPRVVSMSDDSYNMLVEGNDFTRVHQVARKLLIRLLDDIIVVEPRVRGWYQGHYGKGIWLPIIRDEQKEIARYARLLPLSNQLNERYGLRGKKVVLFVGRLVELKNVERLIKAHAKTEADSVLVIVGDGPLRKEWECAANDSGKRVVFTGLLQGDELYAWYNIADVFVLPSYQEAFGAVTNEALIAGCHTLVSKNCGSACLIDEKNGAVFDPFDEDALAKAIDDSLSQIEKGDTIVQKPCRMNVKFEDIVRNLSTL